MPTLYVEYGSIEYTVSYGNAISGSLNMEISLPIFTLNFRLFRYNAPAVRYS